MENPCCNTALAPGVYSHNFITYIITSNKDKAET